jgi:HEPN domain-containing protein
MDEYKLWLQKAKEDLLWTENSLEGKIFYGACFTAHQATEKALKSFLLFHKKPLRKVHDLRALLEDCIKMDKDFEMLRDSVITISPYYIETRYPIYEELASFNEKEARGAHEVAQKAIEFVERRIK